MCLRTEDLETKMVEELTGNYNDTMDLNIFLMFGSDINSLEIVKLAVSGGADVDFDLGYAMRQALAHDNYEMVRFLVESGAYTDY